MNNSLINMSEYQKVIFVNGIDENNLPNDVNSIRDISAQYPFVVFFTKNSGELSVNNIWNNGIRLTRFIDVDDNHNTLTIDNHSFKLLFDYDSGKLGVYEAHPLKGLEYIGYSYTDINGNRVERSNSLINDYFVDAKDNKFTLKFKFIAGIDDDSHVDPLTIDVRQIIKNLKFFQNNILTSNFNVININEEPAIEGTIEGITEGLPKQQICNFECAINKDTFNETNPLYSAISVYNNNISTDLNLILYLNPTEYYLECNGFRLPHNIPSNIIEHDNTYTITVKFNSAITSDNIRKYYISLNTDNSEYVDLSFRNKTEIINGQASFTINVEHVPNNTQRSIPLTFKVSRKIGSMSEEEYDYLTQTYIINPKGNDSYKFYYYGFVNPMSDEFDSRYLISFDDVDDDMIGKEVLYDLEENYNYIVNKIGDLNQTFYIAIPVIYKKIIKPRWDAFEYSPYDNDEDGRKYYVDNSYNCIKIAENYEIDGIKYVIYSTGTGLYYGKIQ